MVFVSLLFFMVLPPEYPSLNNIVLSGLKYMWMELQFLCFLFIIQYVCIFIAYSISLYDYIHLSLILIKLFQQFQGFQLFCFLSFSKLYFIDICPFGLNLRFISITFSIMVLYPLNFSSIIYPHPRFLRLAFCAFCVFLVSFHSHSSNRLVSLIIHWHVLYMLIICQE